MQTDGQLASPLHLLRYDYNRSSFFLTNYFPYALISTNHSGYSLDSDTSNLRSFPLWPGVIRRPRGSTEILQQETNRLEKNFRGTGFTQSPGSDKHPVRMKFCRRGWSLSAGDGWRVFCPYITYGLLYRCFLIHLRALVAVLPKKVASLSRSDAHHLGIRLLYLHCSNYGAVSGGHFLGNTASPLKGEDVMKGRS
jgi:hypothetical protein